MNLIRQTFWVAALGIIAAFAFFLTLGAIDPGEAVAATLVVAALAVAWIAHAALEHRHPHRDPRSSFVRERRGF